MGSEKEMEVVKGLDLSRYMGRWYEIACFPSRFQPRDGENTRATYTLREDGTVHVLNETFSGGKRSYIEGTAYKADPNSDEAKLKVKFYVPPFLPLFPVVGDYWVLYIDEEYQYALIGQPSRRYLWILCRTPCMPEDIYNMLVQKAVDEGYDVNKLHKTPQADPPPEDENVPQDKGHLVDQIPPWQINTHPWLAISILLLATMLPWWLAAVFQELSCVCFAGFKDHMVLCIVVLFSSGAR